MSNSILLISAEKDIADAVGAALGSIDDIKIKREDSSVAKLNGTAVAMASNHDIVIFATDPSNVADLSAIEVLTDQRKADTVYLALTDGDLPLSKARALTRAGVDDVLPFPGANDELVEQVNEWLAKKRAALEEKYAAEASLGKVISVQQARCGIGSTTVAVNL
ncbi:unnamed protein product, partial [Ectocarpus sp. 12 AP-2014]